jgi:glycerol-3-phosphate dehydrogenase subunit C
MKAEYYAEGVHYARRMARALAPEDDPPDVIVTDCSLAGQRILAENRVHALHPIVALAEAYGLTESGARRRTASAELDQEDA